MIEVNHITKRFGKVTAVDDFTLDINRGLRTRHCRKQRRRKINTSENFVRCV